MSLTGRSGAGKTTLLHILAGLDRPSEGRVSVAGTDLGALAEADLARHRARHVGVVFQALNLLNHLSVAENVMLPAVFRRHARTAAARRALEALDRVGLADRADDLPGTLSGGERQRVALARAAFCTPDVLLCDEVTGNLDAATATEVVALILDLSRSDGVAVVAATHDPALEEVSDRILVLSDGRLEAETEEGKA